MENLMQLWGLAGVPFVAALVQVAKAYFTDKRSWPLIAIVLGVALNMGIAVETNGNLVLGLLLGVVTGLAASGLWSAPKNALGL